MDGERWAQPFAFYHHDHEPSRGSSGSSGDAVALQRVPPPARRAAYLRNAGLAQMTRRISSMRCTTSSESGRWPIRGKRWNDWRVTAFIFIRCRYTLQTTQHQEPLNMNLRLHDAAISGHSYRVRLFLALLGLPHTVVPVNLQAGEHKTAAFLRLNAFGQVPVLEDGDMVIADSNAILVYLAESYASEAWYPRTPQGKATVQRWLSVAAGPLAFHPAAARRANLFKRPIDADLIKHSHELFAVIEKTLSEQAFLAGTHATIADLALYSYTVVAPEGNVSLDAYPNIRSWLVRIEALPGFVAMPRSKVSLSA